jgi:hypothetical protein
LSVQRRRYPYRQLMYSGLAGRKDFGVFFSRCAAEAASARRSRDDEFEVGDPVRQTERQAGRADVLMAMSVVQMPMLPTPCILATSDVGGVVPQRTATSNSCSRAKRTAAMTSPPFPQNSMSVGRRSIRPSRLSELCRNRHQTAPPACHSSHCLQECPRTASAGGDNYRMDQGPG